MRRATVTIPPDLELLLESYMESQEVPASFTRIVQAALLKFLAEPAELGAEIREPSTGYGSCASLPLDPETRLKLQEEARRSNTSPDELVASIVREFLERSVERRAPRGVGRYRSGRNDVSIRAEEILRGAAERDR